MSLEVSIKDIVARLREGRFPNEQSISQGIVLRLLQECEWDTWDTKVVWPEYKTGEGRADFAICHPPAKPVLVIEVKQPGKAEDSVRQALEYAFHTGAPMVVLTDGRTWSFYLPGERGSYEDRRVYKLDLYERSTAEAADVFVRYLGRLNVASGASLEAARKEYRSRNRRAEAKATIPVAWRELVEKGDEELVGLLASEVESRPGVRPEADDVAEFLSTLSTTPAPLAQKRAAAATPVHEPPRPTVPSTGSVGSSRSGSVTLLGTTKSYGNLKDAMLAVLTELAHRDSGFLARCAEHPNNQGRTRRYIARSREELYPERPDLQQEASSALPGGWFIGTNMNNLLKQSILRMAAEVAGLRFGHDLTVQFGAAT